MADGTERIADAAPGDAAQPGKRVTPAMLLYALVVLALIALFVTSRLQVAALEREKQELQESLRVQMEKLGQLEKQTGSAEAPAQK